MLLEKSSLSSILKEFLEFLEQAHLVLYSSVLEVLFVWFGDCCSYPPSPWAMGSSRLWRPLGPFPFSFWVPQPLYAGFPRGWCSFTSEIHTSAAYGILPQRVTIRIKSKSCFVNLLPIEAENEFCKLVFVNRIISASSRCTHVTSVLTLVKPGSWFSSWQWSCNAES